MSLNKDKYMQLVIKFLKPIKCLKKVYDNMKVIKNGEKIE